LNNDINPEITEIVMVIPAFQMTEEAKSANASFENLRDFASKILKIKRH
jgi:hypothetical protein